VALIAGGNWRAVLAAGATIVAMSLATWGAFGTETFQAFFDSLAYSRVNGLEYSNTGFHKMQSMFAAMRLIGASVTFAYVAHMTLIIACAGALALLWGGRHDMRLKAGGLLVASLIATPYGFDYDLMLLGPALAALVSLGLEKGFRPWEKSVLAGAWAVPLVARGVAQVTFMPIGLLMLLALFLMVMLRTVAADRLVPTASHAATRS
jgi:hypothetical protein